MKALQIKATLRYVRPPIWRRLLVSEQTNLHTLHEVLQIAMGWTDSHLYAFEKDGQEYLDPAAADDFRRDWLDVGTVRLADLRLQEKSRFLYTYDFGDGWEHDLLVEAVRPWSEADALLCLTGRRACPPEDCGGPPGYSGLVEALRDPANADPYFLEWIPDDFDPEHFDPDAVNRRLRPYSGPQGVVLPFPSSRRPR